jgi:hypothetical protein
VAILKRDMQRSSSVFIKPTPMQMAAGMGLIYEEIPELMTMTEFADLLGLSHGSINQARTRGTLNAIEDAGWGGVYKNPRYYIKRDEGIRWAYYRSDGPGRIPEPGTTARTHYLTWSERRRYEAMLLEETAKGPNDPVLATVAWMRETAEPEVYMATLREAIEHRGLGQFEFFRMAGIEDHRLRVILQSRNRDIPKSIWETARDMGLMASQSKRKKQRRS